MTNQTPVWMPPPRRGFWSRFTPLQRVGLIAAGLILPCTGGLALIGALAGVPAQPPAGTTAATRPAGSPAATTDEPATDEPALEAATTGAVPSVTPVASAAVARKTVTVTKSIAYSTKTVKDPDLAEGRTKVRTKGVAGVRTLTYEVTYSGGEETGRTLVSTVVTRKPVTKVVAVGTKAASSCDPNYTGACVPIASDVDCAGGSGDGPAYVQGPVTVVGDDIYGLDNDGDGVACTS